jgi:uncharacterized protein with beta-barrel porin domain
MKTARNRALRSGAIRFALVLGLAVSAFSASAQNLTQVEVQNAWAAACGGGTATGALAAQCGPTGGMLVAGADYNATFEEIAARTRQATNANTRQLSALGGRLAALRAGSRGILVTLRDPETGSPADLDGSLGWATGGGAADPDPSLFQGGRLGLFLNGHVSSAHYDGTRLENPFDGETYGGTGGIDFRLSENAVIGAAYGYSDVEVDIERDPLTAAAGGDVDSDHQSASLYGTVYFGETYVDAIASYSWADYDMTRLMAPVGGLAAGSAESDTDGYSWSGALSIGHNLTVGRAAFTPFLRGSYLDGEVDSFTETGVGAPPIQVDDQEFDSLVSSLGMQISYTVDATFGVLVPFARGSWEHEFLNDDDRVVGRFIEDTAVNPFRIETEDPDRDYAAVAGGFSAVFPRGVQAFVQVEAVLGLRDVANYVTTGGVRFEF